MNTPTDDEISYCHPGNMSTRYVQPASIGAPKWAVDIQHHYRQALRDDITARYENTLRSLDDGKRAAALSDLAALDGETM